MSAITESDHYDILLGVKAFFTTVYAASDRPNIWGFGPVMQQGSSDNIDCEVLVDPGVNPGLPNKIDVGTWKVFFNKVKRKRHRLKLNGPERGPTRRTVIKVSLGGAAGAVAAGQATAAVSSATVTGITWICPPPSAPPGPVMGGDAIYNSLNIDPDRPRNTFWGSVAYVGSATGQVRVPGGSAVAVANSAVSCAHVLYHNGGGDIRTTRYTSGLTFSATLPGWPSTWPAGSPPASGWPDLADAAADATVPVMANTLRALGAIAGVAAPRLGDVVAKYGATTGLTVARDRGMVWRRLPDVEGNFYLVRAVAGQFSRRGDSGAAIVYAGNTMGNRRRKLAGFVLAGSAEDGEQYYLPALEWGQTNPFAEMSAVEVML